MNWFVLIRTVDDEMLNWITKLLSFWIDFMWKDFLIVCASLSIKLLSQLRLKRGQKSRKSPKAQTMNVILDKIVNNVTSKYFCTTLDCSGGKSLFAHDKFPLKFLIISNFFCVILEDRRREVKRWTLAAGSLSLRRLRLGDIPDHSIDSNRLSFNQL